MELFQNINHQGLSVQQVAELMTRKKKRLLVKKGIENIALPVEEIACIYTENKVVFVIDGWGKKYVYDKNLSEVQSSLEQELFFRANRQYLVNIHFVRGFKTFERVKLKVDLKLLNDHQFSVIISQEMSPHFKRWIAGE